MLFWILSSAGAILLITLLVVFLYLSFLDGDLRISRSIVVRCGRSEAFAKVLDFPSWSEWSPWVLHEPEACLSYGETPDQEGGSFSWDGKRIGAGKLTHTKVVRNETIEQELLFFRPHKSKSRVFWTFEDASLEEVKITWGMEGKMPFLLRFLTAGILESVGNDYDLGLQLLSQTLDSKADVLQIEFQGEENLPSSLALCESFTGPLKEMREEIGDAFAGLTRQAGEEADGMPFVAYWKMVSGETCRLDFAIPVKEGAKDGEFARKNFSGGRYYNVRMRGDYRFLKLVWPTAFSHLQMLGLHYNPRRPSFERYEVGPDQSLDANDWVTNIRIPVK